jgi:hypothetical protein
MKFNHFCADKDSQSADAYYMADVWEFFLGHGEGHSGFLQRNNITKLYVSGDHGPHFSSARTLWNESTLFEKHGIVLHMFFLCSYHAFNRCDGAGVESKKIHTNLMRTRTAQPLAADVAGKLNESEHNNSVGIPFGSINRGADIFNVELIKDDHNDLRSKCEVKFEWKDDAGLTCRESGVILCRDIPADPNSDTPGRPYNVLDLRSDPPGGPLCKTCSLRMQRPIRHRDVNGNHTTECDFQGNLDDAQRDEKDRCIQDGTPSTSRLEGSGLQLDKNHKRNMAKPKSDYGCRVPGCYGFHWYLTYHASNNHMRSRHFVQDGSELLYLPPAKKSGTHPCKVLGCLSNHYTSIRTANKHMKDVHAITDEDDRLYAKTVKVVSSKAPCASKAAVASS